MTQLREEIYFTKGRVIVRGKTVKRGEAKKADYILFYKPNVPVAVVEAKDNNHSVGAARAEYGKELLKELSARLTEEFGSGFSEHNLRSFRSFYRTYQERSPQIWQKPSAKFAAEQKSQKFSGELAPVAIAQKPSGRSPFTLRCGHDSVMSQ